MEETTHLKREDLNCKIQSLKVREKVVMRNIAQSNIKCSRFYLKDTNMKIFFFVNAELLFFFSKFHVEKLLRKIFMVFKILKGKDLFFSTGNVFLKSTVFIESTV